MQKKIVVRPNGQKPAWYEDLLNDLSVIVDAAIKDNLEDFFEVEDDECDGCEYADTDCCTAHDDDGVTEEVQRDITHDMWMKEHPEWHEIKMAYKDGNHQHPAIDDACADDARQIKNTLAMCYALAAYVYSNANQDDEDGQQELAEDVMNAVAEHIKKQIVTKAIDEFMQQLSDEDDEEDNDNDK